MTCQPLGTRFLSLAAATLIIPITADIVAAPPLPSVPNELNEETKDPKSYIVERALERHGEIVLVSRVLGPKETGEDLLSSLYVRKGYVAESVIIDEKTKKGEPNLAFLQALRAAIAELNPDLDPGTQVKYFILKDDLKDGEKLVPVPESKGAKDK